MAGRGTLSTALYSHDALCFSAGKTERMELTTLETGALLLDASTVQFLTGHVTYHALTGPYWADQRVADLLRAILVKQAEQKRVAESEESDLYALTHALSF